MQNYSRRKFIGLSAQAGVSASLAGRWLPFFLASETGFKVHIFSKHLQWLDYAELAQRVKKMGFAGVDLTVRPGGHVEPANVEKDLPRVMEQLRKAGLQSNLITTAIESIESPYAEQIIKTASQQGINYYRMGWIQYDHHQSIEQNLQTIEKQMTALADMNRHYGIRGAYQNHAGTSVGAAVWDIWLLLKAVNSDFLGCQYDLRHAMVEGMNSWELGFELVAPYINTLTVKDFRFSNEGNLVNNVPLGKGIIKWADFFKRLKAKNIQVPIIIHCEYPLGGAENGARTLSLPPEEVFGALHQDLQTLQGWIKD